MDDDAPGWQIWDWQLSHINGTAEWDWNGSNWTWQGVGPPPPNLK
jgi:hypothetical protein